VTEKDDLIPVGLDHRVLYTRGARPGELFYSTHFNGRGHGEPIVRGVYISDSRGTISTFVGNLLFTQQKWAPECQYSYDLVSMYFYKAISTNPEERRREAETILDLLRAAGVQVSDDVEIDLERKV
jgi:hypothetical protein